MPVLTGEPNKQEQRETLRKRVLFIHGGGDGAYEEDRKLAASLQDALGAEYDVRCPKMPDEDRPEYEAWKEQIAKELAALDGEVILVGHSLGASILLKYLSEEKEERPVPGYFSSRHPTGAKRIGKSASTRCEKTLRRSYPKNCRYSFTTAAMTNGYRSRTLLCTKQNSRRQPFASSMAEDTSSMTISRKSLWTSRDSEGGPTGKTRSEDGMVFDP